MKMLLVFMLLFSFAIILTNCGSEASPSPDPSILFQDNFSSYAVANPWAPVNGWNKSLNSWLNNTQIVQNGSNKTLQPALNGYGALYRIVPVQDYTIQVKIKPFTNVAPSFCAIFSQYHETASNKENMYQLLLNNTGFASLYKCVEGSCDGIGPSGAIPNFDSTTWYTLTLTVKSGIITGTITDGVNTFESTHTDPSPFTIGEGAGFLWNPIGSDTDTEFDDVLITK